MRKHAKATAEQITAHNQKAQEVGQDSYESAAYKGFTLTSYRDDGKVDGLEIIDGPEMGKQASLVDSLGKQDIYKTNGLARTIVNQNYLDTAKQTFSITLHNIKDFKDEIAQAEASIKH
ncbi:Membrane-associated lipoprotein precursor [Mycoplasmopsis arginini]|nr:Membrane-associated lipoprotein precursor [Chlamydia abortus]SGA25732.1 Membrane-associated lipoprotein precursor [Mycoplasmopsis arginini]SGA26846.1 Membrane-associated lipoprotein precursor [Mycoplasmopsis arginini]SGA30485.1 Membrane-associated lipoprotein precursor [Chlamydia abortus]